MFSWDARDGSVGQQKALLFEIHGFTASIPVRTSYFQETSRISGQTSSSDFSQNTTLSRT